MSNVGTFNKEIITYNRSLDGLRGIAILLVILWHYVACLLHPNTIFTSSARSLLASTWSGVDLFFVLSGFLLGRILMVNINSKNFYSTFYIRRILRIFPLYYLFLIIYFLYRGISIFFHQPINYGIPYGAYIFHIQNFFMSKSFGDPSLGVTWSLAIEEQFYLILPLLIRISKRYIKYIILAGIVIAPLIRYQLGGNAAYVLLPARIDSLLFGVGIAYLLVTGKLNWCLNRSKELLVSVAMLLVLIALLSIYTDWNRTGGVFNHSIYALLYSIIVIITLQGSVNVFKKILEMPLLVYIGKVSYGLYLIHVPVLIIVFFLSGGQSPKLQGITDLFLIFISFVFCLLLLFLSYKYFETPIRNLGMRFSYQEK